jgi:hypothetical protein
MVHLEAVVTEEIVLERGRTSVAVAPGLPPLRMADRCEFQRLHLGLSERIHCSHP